MSLFVAIRFPDGKRIQRKFPTTCPVSVLKTWCVSENLQAAGGKAFSLSPTTPGATALTVWDVSIEESGVRDSMLQFAWVED